MRSITLCAVACLTALCSATTIKEISFEDLVATSDQIVSGRVTRSWTSWGSEHKFIWTRYEIAVDNVIHGARDATLVVSEPGGVLDGRAMSIESAVRYTIGEHVVLFLHQFPSGDKRTVGWGQGKFTLDDSSQVHASAGGPIAALKAISYTELRRRVMALLPRRVTP